MVMCLTREVVGKEIRIPDLCFCTKIWVRSGFGRVISGAFVRFLSHQGALDSMSYIIDFRCHGRGRGFERLLPAL
jgi:hypothetical protein